MLFSLRDPDCEKVQTLWNHKIFQTPWKHKIFQVKFLQLLIFESLIIKLKLTTCPLCAVQHCHIMIIPLPCLTGGTVILGLENTPRLLQHYCGQTALFLSCDHELFLQCLVHWCLICQFWRRSFFLGHHPLSPVGLVFQQFPVHYRLGLGWFSCLWTSQPTFFLLPGLESSYTSENIVHFVVLLFDLMILGLCDRLAICPGCTRGEKPELNCNPGWKKQVDEWKDGWYWNLKLFRKCQKIFLTYVNIQLPMF